MASADRTLNSLGKLLTLLDNCCDAQISDWSDLLSNIYKSSGSGANTLGGVYCPDLKGDSPLIGCSMCDKSSDVTALSYKRVVDQGRVCHDKHENAFYLALPTLSDDFTLRFTWIDDTLAADVRPLLKKTQEFQDARHDHGIVCSLHNLHIDQCFIYVL